MYNRQVEGRYRPDGTREPSVWLDSITGCWGAAENSTLGWWEVVCKYCPRKGSACLRVLV